MQITKKAKLILEKKQQDWCVPNHNKENKLSFKSNPVSSFILGKNGEKAEMI